MAVVVPVQTAATQHARQTEIKFIATSPLSFWSRSPHSQLRTRQFIRCLRKQAIRSTRTPQLLEMCWMIAVAYFLFHSSTILCASSSVEWSLWVALCHLFSRSWHGWGHPPQNDRCRTESYSMTQKYCTCSKTAYHSCKLDRPQLQYYSCIDILSLAFYQLTVHSKRRDFTSLQRLHSLESSWCQVCSTWSEVTISWSEVA